MTEIAQEPVRRMAADDQNYAASDPVEQAIYDDYWSFAETQRYIFPDGVTWIEFQVMNEGQKSSYQKSINRDIKINRRSGDASIRSDVADERHALIRNSVVNWNMKRNGQFIGFSKSTLDNWLNVANPRLVEALETEIRKANPWLQGDMTSQDIREEIDRLQEMLTEKLKEEEGKESSSSR